MVQSPDAWQSYNHCRCRGADLNGAMLRRVLQACMNTLRVLVADILVEESAQVILIEHDHVIDDLSLA